MSRRGIELFSGCCCSPQTHHTLGLPSLVTRLPHRRPTEAKPWPLAPALCPSPSLSSVPALFLFLELCLCQKAQREASSSMKPSLISAAGMNRFFWTRQPPACPEP